jgi:transglutaminase superfamily protein
MATQPVVPFTQSSAAVVMPLSSGDQGTAETISMMKQLIDQGMKDPEVNRAAFFILNAARVRDFDFAGQRRAIFNWVAKHIRFVRDITGKETLRTPRETLTVLGGDCDDMTMLLCALFGTIGNQVRIVTISSDPSPQHAFTHVFAEVLDGNRWVAADPARRGAAFGRGPERYYRRQEWPVTEDSFTDVQGLAYYGRLGGRLGRMGDDSVDWSGIANVITAGGNTASNIIRSTNTPELINPLSTLTAAQQQQLLLQQQSALVNPLASLSTIPLYVWVLLGLALVMAERR